MELRPILSALLRNRTGAVLVGLQVALTIALVANALHIVAQRVEKMHRPTGLDLDNVLFVQSYGYSPSYDHRATVLRDLDVLRRVPGVVAAATISQIPLSGGGNGNSYKASPDAHAPQVNGGWFDVDEHGLDALGVRLVAGRAFRPDEIVWDEPGDTFKFVHQIILTRALAERLFGTDQVVGRTVYDGSGAGAEVIGVVDRMIGSWVDSKTADSVAYQPVRPRAPLVRYVIRTRPGDRDRVAQQVERLLERPGSGRFVTWVHPLTHFYEKSYRPDRRMISFLATLSVLMVAVTALGIVGLATFHVNARRKQIGTRRAVGARRIDIVRYFLLENGLLALAGSLAGAALAYGFSWWLTTTFQLPPLAPAYVAASALGLIAVGQCAVLWPARRAAAIPPAVATRTV